MKIELTKVGFTQLLLCRMAGEALFTTINNSKNDTIINLKIHQKPLWASSFLGYKFKRLLEPPATVAIFGLGLLLPCKNRSFNIYHLRRDKQAA